MRPGRRIQPVIGRPQPRQHGRALNRHHRLRPFPAIRRQVLRRHPADAKILRRPARVRRMHLVGQHAILQVRVDADGRRRATVRGDNFQRVVAQHPECVGHRRSRHPVGVAGLPRHHRHRPRPGETQVRSARSGNLARRPGLEGHRQPGIRRRRQPVDIALRQGGDWWEGDRLAGPRHRQRVRRRALPVCVVDRARHRIVAGVGRRPGVAVVGELHGQAARIGRRGHIAGGAVIGLRQVLQVHAGRAFRHRQRAGLHAFVKDFINHAGHCVTADRRRGRTAAVVGNVHCQPGRRRGGRHHARRPVIRLR